MAGGAEGARRGAVITAGGTPEGYKRTRPMLEAIAAKIHGEPCVSYLGPAAACHFVKMVNAGIGHGLMQLLRETLSLAERTLPPNEEEVRDVFGAGSLDALNGCWTEVSGDVFNPLTESTLRRRIKERLEVVNNNDLAGRLAQTTLELAVEAPTIQAGLGPREAAARERRRALALTPSRQPVGRAGEDPDSVLEELHGALYAAVIIAYTGAWRCWRGPRSFTDFRFIRPKLRASGKVAAPLARRCWRTSPRPCGRRRTCPICCVTRTFRRRSWRTRNICGAPSGARTSWTSGHPECWRRWSTWIREETHGGR